VAYDYQPRDPRGKLREVTTRWTASMRVAGRAPNRTIVFGEDGSPGSTPQAQGWLVDDRRPGATGDRYLIMDDGDVWRASKDGASPALDAAVAAWLAAPDDDLVTILARALGDARLGGSGWLEVADGVQRVDDRRQERKAHEGPDRREG
jgi:hypothetical protein